MELKLVMASGAAPSTDEVIAVTVSIRTLRLQKTGASI
jgi:hypothetical protein